MQNRLNPHISVDCAVFGFDFRQLSVLLVKPQAVDNNPEPGKLQEVLPGQKIGNRNFRKRILKLKYINNK